MKRSMKLSVITAAAMLLSGAVLVLNPAHAQPSRYEAEDSPATCDGTIDSNHAGYSGSGFCNGDNTTGAAATFTINATSGGTATLDIRYANGTTTNRPADITVNGNIAQANLPFNGTGDWANWATTSLSVPVNTGTNTIAITPTTSNGLPNIDYLEVTSGSVSPPPTTSPPPPPPQGTVQMEALDRGVVSVPSGGGNFVSWRLLGTDPTNVAFNVYRGGALVNSSPITGSTNLFDGGAPQGASYTVRAVVNGSEQAASPPALRFGSGGYLDVPVQPPASGYTINDASAGDLDGDGQYEIVFKWERESRDNSQSGFTDPVYLDGVRLNGQRLWRINLGINIRAGAHYTQFQVYDYDGDGRAEVAMKTADGTVSGTGQVIGDGSADHRNGDGYILAGAEFLSIFDGQTGAILDTVNYQPPRGDVSSWGDSYGNRVDRFLAGTAYLDGARPSMIFARGYYTRSVVWAVDYRNGSLSTRWLFDSNSSGSQYTGQGNHQLSIADADGDGRQEVMYGSMAINDNGSPLWSNGTGHGDAYHVGDLVPSRSGLEVFKPSENSGQPAHWVGDAATGQLLWNTGSCGCDNGRGVAGDVYAGNAGAEVWSSAVSGLRSAASGNQVAGRKPGSTNFLIWWDADPVRELLDSNHIDKYGTGSDSRLLTASGAHSNNGTKATPALSGDLFGDWREEVVFARDDNNALRIYTTTTVTSQRIWTLMHDPQYRVAIAWQNTAYNQPPHPGYFLGNGMASPPVPDIYTP
jgi:rhamnogalacturonan endolyase